MRAVLGDGRMAVEVIDDGVGVPLVCQPEVFDSGIGISNVRERLKVLYGQDFSFTINSKRGKGTRIRLEIPELSAPEKPAMIENASVDPRVRVSRPSVEEDLRF